jgi:hypothetical protein
MGVRGQGTIISLPVFVARHPHLFLVGTKGGEDMSDAEAQAQAQAHILASCRPGDLDISISPTMVMLLKALYSTEGMGDVHSCLPRLVRLSRVFLLMLLLLPPLSVSIVTLILPFFHSYSSQ